MEHFGCDVNLLLLLRHIPLELDFFAELRNWTHRHIVCGKIMSHILSNLIWFSLSFLFFRAEQWECLRQDIAHVHNTKYLTLLQNCKWNQHTHLVHVIIENVDIHSVEAAAVHDSRLLSLSDIACTSHETPTTTCICGSTRSPRELSHTERRKKSNQQDSKCLSSKNPLLVVVYLINLISIILL